MCYNLEKFLMNIKNIIEQLGYSPQEAAVYLAALELGGSTATDIAKKARIPRTSANMVIASLNKKGLINAYIQRKRKIWSAENPEKLLAALKERETALTDILPNLQSLRHDPTAKPKIRVYTGIDEIHQIMNDIIASKQHISALISWDSWLDLVGMSYMEDFIEKRYRHYLRIRVLTPKSKESMALKQKDGEELRTTQFLPATIEIDNCTFLYANKTAIISLNKKTPFGIVIEDESIRHSMEVLFESLWHQSGGA
jgi:sugar-specific transcriptional regulator TrmB